ncbi:MAG: glycosyltransferase [Candidatus Brocadiales bacterium]|nr:glycosyltransferase [Candidatus Brocadiales bacterium]
MNRNNRRKINVVHLVEELTIGGLEKILTTIVLNLNKKKYNVSVWCLREGGFFADKLVKEGIDVKILHISTSRNPLSIYKLYRLLKSHKFDIIHTHAYSAGTIGRVSAFLAGVPVIISHNQNVYDYYNKYYHFVERFLSYITDGIICVSDVVKKFANETQGIDTKKLVTIYNGIENLRSVSRKETSALRKELGIPIDHSVIGVIAQFSEKKGFGYLIRSASILLKCRKDVNFLLVGDGTIMGDMKQLCHNLKIEKNVIFAGERSDIPEMLSLIDIFVLPSIREGLPLAILEAMACGKPVIATNVGGVPEVVKNGINGILVQPQDPEALHGAMKELLNDAGKRERMGRAGRDICAKGFSSRVMVDRIEELYDILLERKRKTVQT